MESTDDDDVTCRAPLEGPPTAPSPVLTPRPAEPPAFDLPGYQIEEVLGRGAMGVVYRAVDLRLKRTVAVKMILRGLDASPEELARFQIEAEAIARLSHPNVIQVFQVGTYGDNPYCVLEHAAGGSLNARLGGSPQSPREAARIVRDLAGGVQAAHEKGIVHRDLKPANVLVAHDGTLKVSDFGLAKRLDVDDGTSRTGAVMGTPSYMPPEQAEGRVDSIGPAVDIYALGAILYELLTGRPPFRGTSLVDTLSQVRMLDPVPPRTLQPGVPRDLETICLKCLEKNPKRRYGSARELGEDLSREMAGEPIVARRVTALERAIKWAGRNRAVAALSAGLAAAVLLGVTGIVVQWLRAVAAGERAERARVRAEEALRKAEATLYAEHISTAYSEWTANRVGRARSLLERCPTQLRHFEWGYLDRLCRPERLEIKDPLGMFSAVAVSPDGSRVAVASYGRAASDPLHLHSQPQTGRLVEVDLRTSRERVLDAHDRTITALAYSPDSSVLASGSGDGKVKIWSGTTHRVLPPPSGHPVAVRALAFSSDGRRIAAAAGDGEFGVQAGHLTIWDTFSSRLIATISDARCTFWGVAFHPRDPTVGAAAALNGAFRGPAGNGAPGRGDAVSRTVDRVFPGQLSPGPEVPTEPAAEFRLLDASDLRELGRTACLPGKVVFAPDGRQAIVLEQQSIARFTIPGVVPRPVIRIDRGMNLAVTFDLAGQEPATVLTALPDGVVEVWDVLNARTESVLRGHQGRAACGALLAKALGRLAITGGEDGTARVRSLPDGEEGRPIGGAASSASCTTLSSNGRSLAWADGNGNSIHLLDLSANSERILSGHTNLVAALAFDPSGALLASAGWDRKIRLWDTRSGSLLRVLPGHTNSVHRIVFTPDGRKLLSCGWDRTVRMWDVRDGRQFASGLGAPGGLAVRPDGRVAAVTIARAAPALKADKEDRVGEVLQTFWIDTGRALNTQPVNSGPLRHLLWDPSGRILASAGDDAAIRLWDGESTSANGLLEGHTGRITAMIFSSDGRRLFSAGADRTLRIWDVSQRLQLLALPLSKHWVQALWLADDGSRLLLAGGRLEEWSARPAR